MLLTIAATVAVLAVLILVHELGHFAAARWFDIRVPRFSIGLGPKVFGFRRGETEYRISAFPLGGYVKVAGLKEMGALEGGDDDDDTDPERTFEAKHPAARAAVLAAGVTMNAVLAVLLFAVVAAVWGVPVPPDAVVGNVVEEWLPAGAEPLADLAPGARVVRVGDQRVDDMDQVARAIARAPAGPLTIRLAEGPPVTIEVPTSGRERQLLPFALEPATDRAAVIGEVDDGGAAALAGLRPGDRVRAVEGRPVATWQQLAAMVEAHPAVPVGLDVERADGGRETVRLTPASTTTVAGPRGRIGASPSRQHAAPASRIRKGPIGAVGYGLSQSRRVVAAVFEFLGGLVDGRHSARELGGPVLIGQLSGAAARAGLATLLTFTALLSLNLAVINLLPIPALDGGHLVILAIEVIRGRPVSERLRLALGRAGTAFVVILMLWAVASDVLRIVGL